MSAYFLFEVLCFLIAVIFCFDGKYPVLRMFVPFLLIIVLYEYGTIQGWFTINKSNLWAVNIITLLEFIFYSFTIRSFLKVPANRRYFLSAIIIVVILSLLNITFIQGFWKFHSYTFLLGAIVVIGFTCVYFYELLHHDLGNISVIRYPFFWIATGVLISYLGEFLFFAFFEYMAYRHDNSYGNLFEIISAISNVILYSCLSIAFISSSQWIRK